MVHIGLHTVILQPISFSHNYIFALILSFNSEISFLQENYKLEDSYLDEIASKIFLASATK